TTAAGAFAPVLSAVVTPAPVQTAESATREAELQALGNATAFAPPADQQPSAAEGSRSRLDGRWSPELEAELQQSLPRLYTGWARGAAAYRASAGNGAATFFAGLQAGHASNLNLYAGQRFHSTGVAGGPNGLNVTIMGDTNRDGIVDDQDLPGHDTWTT